MNDDRTDEQIAIAIQQGDTELFGVLMQRYEVKLLRYGHKFLAREEHIEDVVQDVFIKAFQYIQGFDSTRRFSPWIYRIAHNMFVNEIKRSSKSPQLMPDFDLLMSYTVYEDPAETERERINIRADIEKGLATLPEKYREVLVLRYYEDMEYKDIADVLQIPLGTVSVRIQRAKQALEKQYKQTIL